MANQVTVTWQEGMHFEGLASGHTVQMDVPPPNGQNLGVGPMTLVLVALGGCTAMDVVHILQKERQDVTGVTVQVRGEKASDYPMVYTDIEVVYQVRGRDLARPAVEHAVHLSETKYCSVGIMLGKTARFTTRIEIEQDTTPRPAVSG